MTLEMRQMDGIAEGSPLAAAADSKSAFFSAAVRASDPAVALTADVSSRPCSQQ